MIASNEPKQVNYNDKFVWVFLLPLIAIAVVHIANENPFSWLIHNPFYYADILFSFVVTYLISFYVKKTILYLDKRVPWQSFKKRFLIQTTFCLLLPCIFLVIIESAYLLYVQKISFAESAILNYELPITFIFLILLQLLYFVMYQQQLTRHLKDSPHKEAEKPLVIKLAVNKGNKETLIDTGEISYFYTLQKNVFFITPDNKTYSYGESLEELAKKLEPSLFYRVNRQVIANRKSITSVEHTLTRKLQVKLSPPIDTPVFVSKVKATDFLKWWRNDSRPVE